MSFREAIKRAAIWFLGDYQIWKIYSIEIAGRAQPPDGVVITLINDPAIFQAPLLEDDLKRADWQRSGSIGFAAWMDGQLAGVCWFWPGPLLSGRNVGSRGADEAELIQITIAKRWRGKGIGPQLINHGAWSLQQMGYRRLYAQIWHSNRPSEAAFRKTGWEHVAWFIEIHPRLLRRPIRFRKRVRKAVGCTGLEA
jgi:GNAT superfamily N-acetyltransferase